VKEAPCGRQARGKYPRAPRGGTRQPSRASRCTLHSLLPKKCMQQRQRQGRGRTIEEEEMSGER